MQTTERYWKWGRIFFHWILYVNVSCHTGLDLVSQIAILFMQLFNQIAQYILIFRYFERHFRGIISTNLVCDVYFPLENYMQSMDGIFFSAILSCNLSPRWTAAAVRLILLPISWNNKLDKNVKNVENKWRILHLEWWSINNIVQTLRVWFNSDVNLILYSFQQLNTPRPYSLYTEYLKYKSAQVFSKSIIVSMQFP